MTNRILNNRVEVWVKNILLFYLFTFLPLAIGAQTLTVSAPAQVSAGENFRISYTVSTQDVDDFRSGIHSNDVAEIIAGPYTSTQSRYQMTNGHATSSSSITYTYTLYALKNGTFSVPAATAVVDGKQIQSKATKVTVTGTARQQSGPPDMHQDNEPQ
ncbi:MAG: BatD family protein, partial [Prevotella sp.]|nr:BatD family protein [Prevotella sp.]